MASSIADGAKTWPQGTSIVCTSASARSAISARRCPKRPKTGTSTRSPGRTSETIAASMPARDVPSTRRVASLRVAHTARYSSWVSAMAAVMNGSYWPTSGADIARSTLGYAEIGPGPMSRRAGGSIGPGIASDRGAATTGPVLLTTGFPGAQFGR